jgi:hypothetical protein
MNNNDYIDNDDIDVEEYPSVSIKRRGLRRVKTKHIIKRRLNEISNVYMKSRKGRITKSSIIQKLHKKLSKPGYLKKPPILSHIIKIERDVIPSSYKKKIYNLKKYIELKEQYEDYLEDNRAS